jgi:hypothetical protein
VLYLRFEDVQESNNQRTIKIYRSKKDRHQHFGISKLLFEEIMNHKKELTAGGRYISTTRLTTRGERITGHFIFEFTKDTLSKRFVNGFGGILTDIKLRPKDLRISSISDRNTHGSLIEAAALADHRTTRITREHYTRAAVAFESGRTNYFAS